MLIPQITSVWAILRKEKNKKKKKRRQREGSFIIKSHTSPRTFVTYGLRPSLQQEVECKTQNSFEA